MSAEGIIPGSADMELCQLGMRCISAASQPERLPGLD